MTKLLAALGACAVLSAQAPQSQPPVFRSGATLVPLDVRVLDRDGKPITDLKQSEFVVTEDGKPQTVAHFSMTSLVATPASDVPGLLRATAVTESLKPPTRRVFLLVLGRGRLQGPSKGVEAMLQFVREQVLPQDQVAVLAWNRATDFTTNHAGLADLIEQFKAHHEEIDSRLAVWFSSLRTIYGDKTIPPQIQKEIDKVFDVPSLGAAHTVVNDPNARTTAGDKLREQADALLTAETRANRIGNPMTDGLDPVVQMGLGGSFDDFTRDSSAATQDLGKLYGAIEYLRFIDGEKHLVFVTEQGIALPEFSGESTLAAVANNARVVIDTIQTGGAPAAGAVSFASYFKLQSLRTMSDLTGGVASAYAYADKATKRIDEATRTSYLLGYYATNSSQDGRYRNVEVKVTRPGAQVFYRHGYFARPLTLPTNRRDMMSYLRMATAFTTAVDVFDIPMGFNARVVSDGDAKFVAIDLSIGLAKLKPVQITPAGRSFSLELAVICANADQRPVGRFSQRLNLTIPEELFQRTLKDGVPGNVSVRVPLTGSAANVKVVVYNFESDLLGSIAKKIK